MTYSGETGPLLNLILRVESPVAVELEEVVNAGVGMAGELDPEGVALLEVMTSKVEVPVEDKEGVVVRSSPIESVNVIVLSDNVNGVVRLVGTKERKAWDSALSA